MSIFERFFDMIGADISDMIDKAENPDAAVGQVITDVQKEIEECNQKLEKAEAGRKFIQRKYQETLKISKDLEEKARISLSQGDRELARYSLAEKIKSDDDAKEYKQVYKSISEQAESLKNRIALLKDKINKAEAEQAFFEVKTQAADMVKEIIKSVAGFADDNCGCTDKKPEQNDNISEINDEISDIDSEIEKIIEDYGKLGITI